MNFNFSKFGTEHRFSVTLIFLCFQITIGLWYRFFSLDFVYFRSKTMILVNQDQILENVPFPILRNQNILLNNFSELYLISYFCNQQLAIIFLLSFFDLDICCMFLICSNFYERVYVDHTHFPSSADKQHTSLSTWLIKFTFPSHFNYT